MILSHSLPNLHDLERIERKQQQLRKCTLRDHTRARDFTNCDHGDGGEKLPKLPYNSYLMAGLGLGAPSYTPHYNGKGIGGGTTLNGLATSKLQHHRHYHQRHSFSTKRVLRTKSSGVAHNILWDDQMIENLASYSPISTRSHRINPVTPYQMQAALAASRRRESINSSIGANSIRRLLTLSKRQCRHKVPEHVRTKICKNFIFLALAHGLTSAILLPMIGLQGSNSVWHHREQWLPIGSNIGSILLSFAFLISTGICFVTKHLIRKLGFTLLIASSYIGVCLFLLCHLYPSIYTLIPAYFVLGICLSPAWISKLAMVVDFGNKLSCSQHESIFPSKAMDAAGAFEETNKVFCNRDQKIRRLVRWYQAAQDFGIILGAIVASIVFACTSSDWNCIDNDAHKTDATTKMAEYSIFQNENISTNQPIALPHTYVRYFGPSVTQGFFDDMYNRNEKGERICGADMCPTWASTLPPSDNADNGSISNESIYMHFIMDKTRSGGIILILIYLCLAIGAVIMTFLPGKIQGTFRHERIKGMTDTLLFAGPMAYFIGTEQAYMLGDFTRAYVACSLGLSMVAGALIGLGIMQIIVSCTLSMLLRHTKRIVVIIAASFFHACLLLALSRWKPSTDDSALFYVIAAGWGACNAMWETLLTALVTLNHTNQVVEVMAPLQALRFLGLSITFAAHGFLCESHKILILVIILVISVPPYAMLEIRLEAHRKAQMLSLCRSVFS